MKINLAVLPALVALLLGGISSTGHASGSQLSCRVSVSGRGSLIPEQSVPVESKDGQAFAVFEKSAQFGQHVFRAKGALFGESLTATLEIGGSIYHAGAQASGKTVQLSVSDEDKTDDFPVNMLCVLL